MASIADLNVRLGLIYKDFDRGLETVERRLRSSGRRLSGLGDQLTVAISLPLAAAGAAAVKSAGDIESLQLALESQLGSTEKARKELELLRIEALKPGLGFEQAVRASVSLQAVGFEAEKARKITSEFGNALALAGKGAAELDGVVLALTQITAKGIVSAEEINQIAERLPQIRTLMQQAFGTASTEAIQKLGITSTQFIEGITTEMQKLPRATGGIKNSLENFFDAIKVGAAKFGLAISKSFDVPGKLEALAAGLTNLADQFAALDPEVQKFIIGTAAIAVVAGPTVKVLGALQSAGAQFIGLLQSAGGLLKGATATVLGLTDAVNRLKLAFGIVGVVAAVAAAVYLLSQRFDAATYAQEQFAAAQKAVTQETAKEIGALDKNFEVLKNVTSTTGERKQAIDELLAQYPSYLKGINLEIQSVDQLTQIQKGLVEQIQRGVAERKKAEAINSIYEKRAEILFRVQQLREGADATAGEATLIDTGDMVRAGSIAGAVIQKLLQQSEDLRTSADNTGRQFDAAFGLVGAAARRASPASQVLNDLKPATDAAAASAGNLGRAQKDQESAAKKLSNTYKEVLSDIANLSAQQDLLGAKNVVDQADAIEAGIKKLLDAGFKPASVEIQNLKAQLQGLFTGIKGPEVTPIESAPLPKLVAQKDPKKGIADSIVKAVEPMQTAGQQIAEIQEKIRLGTVDVAAGFQQIANVLNTTAPTMVSALAAAGAAMADVAATGESSFAAIGNAALKSAAAVVRASLMKAVASYIGDAFVKFGIFGAILAAGASALVGGIFNKALKGLKVPAFAGGTKFHKGGLAITSENGPELLNLPRGTQVTPNPALDRMLGNSNINVTGTFKIAGTDLVVVLEQQTALNKRIRGY